MKAVRSPVASGSGNLVSSRGDARISIAEKWANRRRLQNGQLDGDSSDLPLVGKETRASLSADQGNFSIPPLCVLLRRSWNQAINGWMQHQQSSNWDSKDRKAQTTEQHSASPKRYENNKRIPFPSVLSVLKANAVKLQVESIMLAEENEKNIADDNSDIDCEYGNSNFNGLSVLPANCNDFTTSAVNHMSLSRSRAFLLLDFSAIVQTHTVWRKRLAITKNRKEVQIVYSARHNCNARLLQLLQRLGVGLRVATKYDLVAVREATRDNHTNDTVAIWDDASILVKPNSFYRNLLLHHNKEVDSNENFGTRTRTIPITVGNAEEMERIHNELHRICKRRRKRQSNVPKLEFVLKLGSHTDDFKEWKTVLRNMHKKAIELSYTKVVGVALELGGKCETKTNYEDTRTTGTSIETIKHNLLLDALSDLIVKWFDDITNGDEILLPKTRKGPQIHLTNPITATEIESEVIEWIEKHRKLCSGITIDASRLLMVNAAALCTRIIGVKNNNIHGKKSVESDINCGSSTNEKMSNDENNENFCYDRGDNGNGASLIDDMQQCQEEKGETIEQHIYIDDGCYGSLSNYPNEGIPLPLKSQRLARSISRTSKKLSERKQNALLNTTVWGPTCDGLDKVCSSVALPRLSRDDWLVFTDLGFCHEGTCFNGFSPPDIACCVLGGNL